MIFHYYFKTKLAAFMRIYKIILPVLASTLILTGFIMPANTKDIIPEKDPLILPISEYTGTDILIPSGYRGSEPSDFEGMMSQDWYDFYYDAETNQYRMEKASIIAQKHYDDCLQDSTTWVYSERESILLIYGVEPSKKPIKSILIEKQHVWPQKSYTFGFNNKKYTLRGDGFTIKEEKAWMDGYDEPEQWDEVINYKLYLSEDSTKGEQLIIAMPDFNYTFVKIVWIGDMDGDGKPDFIFDVSPEYEYKRMVLFLSSIAGGNEIVKCAGISEYGFDC